MIARHASKLVEELLGHARVVVLTGPRQAGKTTLARAIARSRRGIYFSLDEEATLRASVDDPVGFVAGAVRPQVIDEVQRAGDPLVRAIKVVVDREDAPGQFVLTGSSDFLTVPNISESLAGRARFVELWPFSQGEIEGDRERFVDALFTEPSALLANTPTIAVGEYWERVCAGGFPEARALPPGRNRARWFADYIRTVTHRDVADVSDIRKVEELPRVLDLLATRTAQELVVQDVVRDAGLSGPTVSSYISLLRTVYLVHTVPAWSRNLTSRVKRHRKVYVSDTGLASHLMRADPRGLLRPGAPAAGPLLETFVVNELVKQLAWADADVRLHHYRDRNGPEVDVVLESLDGRVAVIEVKAAMTVRSEHFRWPRLLRERLSDAFAAGVVLYLGEHRLPFGDRMSALPVSALWQAT